MIKSKNRISSLIPKAKERLRQFTAQTVMVHFDKNWPVHLSAALGLDVLMLLDGIPCAPIDIKLKS